MGDCLTANSVKPVYRYCVDCGYSLPYCLCWSRERRKIQDKSTPRIRDQELIADRKKSYRGSIHLGQPRYWFLANAYSSYIDNKTELPENVQDEFI